MDYISFVWDRKKASENYRKHKVTFEEAETAFIDPNGRMIYDPGHSKNEERFILLGVSSALRILTVAIAIERMTKSLELFLHEKLLKLNRKNIGVFLHEKRI